MKKMHLFSVSFSIFLILFAFNCLSAKMNILILYQKENFMLTYIKKLFKNPREIYTARNMKNKNYFLIILSMVILLTFLSAFNVKEEFDKLSEDYQEIEESIPEYQLVNNQLESDQEGFIYQTDSLVFYFDPQDKIDTQLIDKNMEKQSAPISAALQKNKIYLNILGQNQSLTYSDFDLTSKDLKAIIGLENFSAPIYFIIILFVLFFFNLLLYLIQLFSISVFANFVSFIQGSKLKFTQNAKIAVVASIIPFLTMAILNAFNFSIAYQFEITIASSLILFYLTISEFKKRLKKHKDLNK